MDAYELFIRYQRDNYIPKPFDIHPLFIRGEVRTIELIALMYENEEEKIQMDQVYAHGPEACMQMAETVLTPIVIRNSKFENIDSTAQILLATAMSTATPQATPIRSSTSSTPITRTNTPEPKSSEQKQKFEPDTDELSTVDTEEIEPGAAAISGAAGPSPNKSVRNFVIECDGFFWDKSKTRIKSMTEILKCRVKMAWVRGVASTLQTYEPYSPGDYDMLRRSNRHIHRTGYNVDDFVRALADPTVKTFSWSLQDSEAVHMPKCRRALQKRCSKTKPEQYLTLAMLVCSIGLPTFQMYTPCSFLKKWCPFKDVTNNNVIKALLQEEPGGDAKTLLDEYSPADVQVDGEPGSVELFMFKYWYSHPTKLVLGRIVNYANANLQRCLMRMQI